VSPGSADCGLRNVASRQDSEGDVLEDMER
jgi:hypothetical protein